MDVNSQTFKPFVNLNTTSSEISNSTDNVMPSVTNQNAL